MKHVYFIKPVGHVGPIKIGCSSFVGQRLKTLTLWSPFALEVLYSEEGEHELERNLHRCFADLHSHSEWFHPGDRLLKAIERLQSGMKIAEAIDLSENRGAIRKPAGPRVEIPERKGYRSYSCKLRHAEEKAEKITKTRRFLPFDVTEIMQLWEGRIGYHRLDAPIRPTDEQFRRLDAVIADPVSHCIRKSEWLKGLKEAA